jgi:hypothetical protein
MTKKHNDTDLILAVMADLFDIRTLMTRSRCRNYVLARQLGMKVMREYLHMGLTPIARVFGMHHTSVIHNLSSLNDLLATYDDLACKQWDRVLTDHRLRHIIHDSDQRVCLLIPKHIDLLQFMDHVRLRFPDCEID